MPHNIPPDSEHEIPFTDTAAIIPNAAERAEREKTERDRRADSDHQLILQLQKRQTDAQEIQAKSNKVIAGLTAALVVVSLVSGFVSYLQFTAANNSAEAAKSAANTAANTRLDLKTSGEETKAQVDRIIAEQQRTATAMEQSVVSAKRAMETSERQNREAMQLGQRPYLAVGKFQLDDPDPKNPYKIIGASIAFENVGKSLANVQHAYRVVELRNTMMGNRSLVRETAEELFLRSHRDLHGRVDEPQSIPPGATPGFYIQAEDLNSTYGALAKCLSC